MRFDRQTNEYHIPAAWVKQATRGGELLDITSAHEIHQGGEITLTLANPMAAQALPEKEKE
jgi:hypothetical protein